MSASERLAAVFPAASSGRGAASTPAAPLVRPQTRSGDDRLGAGRTVGVLQVQGAAAEHAVMLGALGAAVRPVRSAQDLEGLDALVLPGGESSTQERLIDRWGMRAPLSQAVRDGLPVLATCAGLILLAERIEDPAPEQRGLGVLPISVRRNAFGRQVASRNEVVETSRGPITASYIRAPQVTGVLDDSVEVIGRRHADAQDDRAPIVAVQRGRVLGLAFHPELTGDLAAHRLLLESVPA